MFDKYKKAADCTPPSLVVGLTAVEILTTPCSKTGYKRSYNSKKQTIRNSHKLAFSYQGHNRKRDDSKQQILYEKD